MWEPNCFLIVFKKTKNFSKAASRPPIASAKPFLSLSRWALSAARCAALPSMVACHSLTPSNSALHRVCSFNINALPLARTLSTTDLALARAASDWDVSKAGAPVASATATS